MLGDAGLPGRPRQRTDNAVTRAAGCTVLVAADIPPHSGPGSRPGARRRTVGPAIWLGGCNAGARLHAPDGEMPVSLSARPGGGHGEPVPGMIFAGVLSARVRCRRWVSPAKTARRSLVAWPVRRRPRPRPGGLPGAACRDTP